MKPSSRRLVAAILAATFLIACLLFVPPRLPSRSDPVSNRQEARLPQKEPRPEPSFPASELTSTAAAAVSTTKIGVPSSRTCDSPDCSQANHESATPAAASTHPARVIPLPLDFPNRITSDGKTAFELPDGRRIACPDPSIESDNQGVVMVSGSFTEPSPSSFFFRRQEFPGVAGKMIGHVVFDGEKSAWKVLPEGPDGDPVLKEVPIGEVVCVGYMPVPENSSENPQEMPQDHTSSVPLPEYQDIIPLQSLPGAPGVIYLDFDGSKGPHDVWSYKGDASHSGLGNSTIRDIWIRVAEDYLPFNINVTTDVKVYENATRGRRIRCIVTPTNWYKAGGIAYVGSYNWGGDPVCWASNYTGDSAVTVISHEVGHTLGLHHHGYNTSEYYGGHGSGATAWAPIMGAGYGKTLKHWSDGSYYLATRPSQKDLTTITNQNGVDFRADDCGNTLANARYLAIATGNTVTNQQGIIETPGDIDAYRFKTSGGAVSLNLTTTSVGVNLDIKADIINAATNAVVFTSDSTSSANATVSTTLTAGEYLLRVTGASVGTPATSQGGYSNYGCLGSYKIEGSVAGGETQQNLSIAENSANGTTIGSITNPATAANETVRAVVTVNDVNEVPVLAATQDTAVLEGTVAGTQILKLNATDPDRFDEPVYEIVSGNTAGYFAINSRTGWITVANAPEVTTNIPVALVVRARDQKSPTLYSVNRNVTITLTNTSDAFTGTPGTIVRTFFKNLTGNAVTDLTSSPNFPNRPDSEVFLPSFDSTASQGDNYGSTIRGYLIPPVSGSYQFWLASDDGGQLILGPNATQTSTPVIASAASATGQYAWDAQTSQASATVTLTAGQPYYIEARQKEGTGNDYVAVAWSGPGISRQVIPGLYLAPFYQNYAPKPSGTFSIMETAAVGTVVGIRVSLAHHVDFTLFA